MTMTSILVCYSVMEMGHSNGKLIIPLGVHPTSITIGDFNNDTRLDLVVADMGGDVVSVLLGNGDGSFQTYKTYPASPYPGLILSGDFNNDKKLDIAVTNIINQGSVSILYGNGDGTFQSPMIYWVGRIPGALIAGAFTDKANLDLAVVNSDDNDVVILLNSCS